MFFPCKLKLVEASFYSVEPLCFSEEPPFFSVEPLFGRIEIKNLAFFLVISKLILTFAIEHWQKSLRGGAGATFVG